MEYKIEIVMTGDEEMALTPYFWCVLGRSSDNWHNCGHGWTATPEEAWKEAKEWYDKNCVKE